MDAHKYRAFISYSHRDSRWASWLHSTLETYHPPKPLVGKVTARGEVPKRLSPIFRDREELPSAVDLSALVNAALKDSACQIVICSPNSAKSRWVNEEILQFKRLGRENRIFSFIIAGEPNATDLPGREHEECFPPALRFKLGPDGELTAERTEPIAADARSGKDGKHRAALKVIAGLLGVGFDTLKQREQQRRNRRLVVISGAAMTGMVVASGLAAFAVVQRDRAERETVRAEAEARTADETTRFLIDLFKVSDPSEARGNSVTAREMLDKGATRVRTELAQEPAVQARLMDTLGTVYTGLGLYSQARPLLDEAVATRRRLAGDVDSVEFSDSLTHQASVMQLQAEYSAGEKAYREAISIASAKPKDRRAQAELATALYGLGTLLDLEGRSTEAEKTLRTALKLQQSLAGRGADPGVARTLKDLARAVADGGDLNAAIPLMRQAVAMERALYPNGPHPDLAEALNDMGFLLDEHSDLDESEKFYREALAMYQRLLGDKHPYVATALENVALILQDKGDLAGAEALYQQSLQMRAELVGEDHPDYAMTLFNVALLQYDRGNTEEAFAKTKRVLAIYRRVYASDQPQTAQLLNTMGFWLTMAGKNDEADRYLQEGLSMRRRLFDEHHPDVASSLMMLAILKVSEQKYAEALKLAQNAKGIYSAALSADHWRTAIAESAEGAALSGLGRYPEAQTELEHSYGILSKSSGAPLIYRTLTQRYLDVLQKRERHAGIAVARTASAIR